MDGMGSLGSAPSHLRQALTHGAGTPDSYQCNGICLLTSPFIS
jgi:hypothetical protein